MEKLPPKPQEFGHGAIEGVAGPEAASNAAASAVPVAAATRHSDVGDRGDPLAAFENNGIEPGPRRSRRRPIARALIASCTSGTYCR